MKRGVTREEWEEILLFTLPWLGLLIVVVGVILGHDYVVAKRHPGNPPYTPIVHVEVQAKPSSGGSAH